MWRIRKGRGVPLFRTNAGTLPKRQLHHLNLWCLLRNFEETAAELPPPPKTANCRRIFFAISRRIRHFQIIWDQLFFLEKNYPNICTLHLWFFWLSSKLFEIFQVSNSKIRHFFGKKITWSQMIQKCPIQQEMAKKNSAAVGGFRRFRRRFFKVP